MGNRKGAVKPGSSHEEVDARIARLRVLLVTCELNAQTRHEVYSSLSKEWDVSERMVRDYAGRARREIDAVEYIDPRDLKACQQTALERAEWTIREAISQGDFRAAVAAQELWCKIAGVDEMARRGDALARSKEKRDAERHRRDMGTSDVKTVRFIVEEAAVPDSPPDASKP